MTHSAPTTIDVSLRVNHARAGIHAMLVTMLLPILLSGCVTTRKTPLATACSQNDRIEPNASLPRPTWVHCLGDGQLSLLNERALATASARAALPTTAQARLSYEIADRYIALRAQQADLVLLAARAQLDGQRATATATRAAAARDRSEIAALRERLAVLTSLAPGLVGLLPGGPIPLPPHDPDAMATTTASARYAAARIAANTAQSQAEHARAIAAQQDMQVRAGTLPAATAGAAGYHALDALQAEQQARAALARAYVALVGSPGRGGPAPAR